MPPVIGRRYRTAASCRLQRFPGTGTIDFETGYGMDCSLIHADTSDRQAGDSAILANATAIRKAVNEGFTQWGALKFTPGSRFCAPLRRVRHTERAERRIQRQRTVGNDNHNPVKQTRRNVQPTDTFARDAQRRGRYPPAIYSWS